MTAVALQMEPGPTLVDDRVIQALAAPPMYHQSADFADALDETCALLKQLYGTTDEVVVLPTSGRGAVESALASVDPIDRPLIVPTNGTFGRMMATVGQSLGMQVVELKHDSGARFALSDIKAELERHDRPILGIVHNETSTGMVNDLAEYVDLVHRRDGLMLVDAVSSLGGTAIDFDDLGVDLCASAAQKSVGAPPGVAFVAVSERALGEIGGRTRPPVGYYLDLLRWWDQWVPREKGGKLKSGYRRLPWTMPTNLVVALRRALELTAEEGVKERWERHRRSGAGLRAAMATLGMHPVAPSGTESNTVGAFRLPGVASPTLRRRLAQRHRVYIAGGLDGDASTVIRIAHMAESARPGPLLHTIAAIAYELNDLGIQAAADPTQEFLKVWHAE
ncbi:alanine--glyoxylate aminotransferase family protein [Saccharopolyspora sp. NPDC050642]|uniref:pyridoxal-phosphate-dependent aminotransferase family protein n=1 Tax=Saccharopolyspora sp. NPDC050642 TaxID=3157099 RepID=UPI00340B4EAF